MAAVGKVVHGVGVEMFEQSVDQASSSRCSDQAPSRAARFTAETTARSEAVVIEVAIPTPHTVRPSIEAST